MRRMVVALIWLMAGGLSAQIGLTRRMADQLLESGDNRRAFEVYRKLLADDPDNAELAYNAGNSLYRLQRYDDARKFYDKALANTTDPVLKNSIRYNLANCDFKEKKLNESVEKYKQVLRNDGNDDDARKNLEFALRQLNQTPPPPSAGDNKQSSKNQDDQDKNDQQQGGQNKQNQDEQQQQNRSKSSRLQPKFSKEEAERLLDALKNQEQDYQRRKAKEKAVSDEAVEKDW